MHKLILKYFLPAALALLLYGNYNTLGIQIQDRDHYLKEKIYVMTDRNIYFTGENIWFKIICTESIYNVPADLSKIAYLELLTRDNNPVSKHITELKKGIGSGCITLPDGLAPGNYQLRAYTNWMKNFGYDCFFEKDLIIINPDEEIIFRKPISREQTGLTADFFPESGRIVKNLNNHIIIRVLNLYNEGINGKALIYKNNDTLQKFDIIKGIGAFDLIPNNTDKYYVKVMPNDSFSVSFALPEVHEQGTILHLSGFTEKSLSFNISSTLRKDKSDDLSFKINIENNGLVCYTESVTLYDSVQTIRVPYLYVPEGIYYVVLLNEKGEILCKRPGYKKPGEKLDIDIIAGKDLYNTREKVDLIISTSVNDKPVPANLSVKVKKARDPLEGQESDFHNKMILDNILFENIFNYYSDPRNNFNYFEINDALLACIDFTDTLPKNFNVKYLPEIKGQVTSGKVIDKETREPVWNLEVYLSFVGPYSQIYTCKTNKSGEFSFSLDANYSSKELVIQLNDMEGKYIVLLNDMFSNSFKEKDADYDVNSEYKDYILRSMINYQISKAYERDTENRDSALFRKRAQSLFQKSDRSHEKEVDFYGSPDESILMEDFIKLPVMEEVLVELLKGVYITVKKGVKYIVIIDKNNNEIIGNSPLYLIDGVPVFDSSVILNLNPAKVKIIKVVTSKYFLGDMVFDGILDIQTDSNNFDNVAKPKTAIRHKFENISCPEAFVSPRYSSETLIKERIPDYRNTLYWNPEILTGTEGTSKVSFYTSDETAVFDIIVEGVSYEGQAGYKKFQIEVDKQTK